MYRCKVFVFGFPYKPDQLSSTNGEIASAPCLFEIPLTKKNSWNARLHHRD